jgi:CRP/FNR family transcriptional regulator, cyclic AMP receptor protein
MLVRSPKKRPLYFQGDPADCVYYVQASKLKGTVAAASGKEIIVGIYGPGDFCGEECLDKNLSRSMTLTSLTECELKSVARSSMLHAISKNAEFSRLFISRMVQQQIRLREDFADVLLDPIERRLARLLLILARRESEEGPELVIACISQEMLADMHKPHSHQPFHEQVSAIGLYRLQRPHHDQSEPGGHAIAQRVGKLGRAWSDVT